MSAPPRFVAWQPVLTDHQAFTLQELGTQSGTDFIAYVLRLEDAVRRDQGWKPTAVTTIEQRILPATGTLRHCIQRMREHRADTHFFCSPFENPILIVTLLWAAARRINFYLVSEPYSPRDEGYLRESHGVVGRIKRRLRPLAYFVYGALIKHRVAGIFAISSLAVDQYRRVGMSPQQLFPFGYFVPRVSGAVGLSTRTKRTATLHIAYVGSLIRRKGVDLLVAAVRGLVAKGHEIALDIFGPGDPAILALGPNETRIRYCGAIPFGSAQTVLPAYDVLVLPSRFDGWGVVVNEAMLAGVPVVCSDRVGARAIVETFGAGSVVLGDDVSALTAALQELAENPAQLAKMRRSTEAAARAIEPSRAAAYMLSVLRAEPEVRARLPSPWYAVRP